MFLQVPGVPPWLVYPHLSLSDHGQGGRHCPWGLITILYFIQFHHFPGWKERWACTAGQVVHCTWAPSYILYSVSPGLRLPRLCPSWGCLFYILRGSGSVSGGPALGV